MTPSRYLSFVLELPRNVVSNERRRTEVRNRRLPVEGFNRFGDEDRETPSEGLGAPRGCLQYDGMRPTRRHDSIDAAGEAGYSRLQRNGRHLAGKH